MPNYTPRTGVVRLRGFDEAVVKQLGAVIKPGTQNYICTFAGGLSPGASLDVPVILNNPEQVYEAKVLPAILVKRDSFGPALARWHSYGHMEQVAGVPGTESIVAGNTVFARVETKPQAWPYDFIYTVSCIARFEHEAQTLLNRVMRSFQPAGFVTVTDSLLHARGYTFWVQGEVQDIGEYVDVAERMHGYSLSFRIEGEIDLVDAQEVETVQTIVSNNSSM